MQDRLDTLAPRVAYLQRASKLGNDAYAQQVAEHMRQAMDSDDRSLVPVFHTLTAGLDNLRHALDVAIRNYDAADDEAARHIRRFKFLRRLPLALGR
ncbi:hypothetical protein [Amycolatopsis methanolica]|uniref:Uncharacterized protein n=1 Tax=Amycolatopsis methanolica 239 TaxID=1068978 RepID=A0A076MJH6_AMYME|nr:hypothetical protein [Amycolatopsis methanolica]AIJ21003.1 hypothetical protein AMETH_0911 [Amycolatopsis methanolica 239]